jgi:hypothetical protein
MTQILGCGSFGIGEEEGRRNAMTSQRTYCPDCGKAMAQQFIGLKHCSCGMSWKKGIGYFKRTSDMVFVLERQTVGERSRQVPVIRYKNPEQ